MKHSSSIVATGAYLPSDTLSNSHLEGILNTTNEWIVSRTGIKERRIGINEAPADLARKAAKDLFAHSDVSPQEVSALLCTTNSSSHIFPPIASMVAGAVGFPERTIVFDIGAGCSAFLVALDAAAGFVESGRHAYVMVLSVEKMSAVADYSDRSTCVLFGDGAAACLLARTASSQAGVKKSLFYQDSKNAEALYLKSGNYRAVNAVERMNEELPHRQYFLHQDGKYVFKVAVRCMVRSVVDLLHQSNMDIDEVDWIIPHQANLRIISAIVEGLHVPEEKVLVNIEKYGNTSSASIPICLAEFEHLFKRGDNIILVAFGTGYITAATHVVWGYESSQRHGQHSRL